MPLVATARVALWAEEGGEGPHLLSLAGTGGDLHAFAIGCPEFWRDVAAFVCGD